MRSARFQHRILALSLVSLIAAVSLGTSLMPNRAGAQTKVSYPRAQVLMTTGTQWGSIQGFNPYSGNYAVGMVGLCNETLLRYDPLKDKYINWLAKSAEFTSAKVFTVKIRSGIKWSNGKAFTASDVAWNYKLGRFASAFWNTLWLNIKSVGVKGNTVTFNFKSTPNYAQWQNLVWNLPMISPVQGKAINNKTLTTYSPSDPIGTGPYVLDTAGFNATTRVVWKKKNVWWAAKQGVAPSPAPTYIIDTCVTNSNWLGEGSGHVGDLNNNYLPGITTLVKNGQAQTYFASAPYDLSANTAWLEVNTTKPALNDKLFRKALATSINVNNIVANDYGNLVLPANATGLLGVWKKWVDQAQVKALGFRFSTAKAKVLLATAGYKDVNGDGYVEDKSGNKIDLKIAVPTGWSDWESARDMIIASAKASGIHLHKDAVDFNDWQTERNQGLFDTVIDNNYQLSDNPWTYYNGIFHLPVIKSGTGQTFANFGRYENQAAWKLVQQLDKTPLSNVKARAAIMKKLQKITLTELPIIPLWYNGVWAQWMSKNWKNWPSSTSKRNYTPSMWRGYMQMTGIDMITHLKPA
jgi:peptide/nickel transport system substrate-binding protein